MTSPYGFPDATAGGAAVDALGTQVPTQGIVKGQASGPARFRHDIFPELEPGLVPIEMLRVASRRVRRADKGHTGCCQTNANQSPLPLPHPGIRQQEGRATRQEQRCGWP
jgi:hypothetical protein